MTVITLGIDRGEFEVQVPCENIEGGGFRPFKYTVQMPPELEPSDHQRPFTGARCECQKPQLTGIPCSHLLAVCKETRYDVNAFVDTRYSMWNLLKTWSGQFHSYGDEDTWPNPNRPKLIPDRTLINRGRRKKIRKQMTMDEMERGKQKQKEARKKRKSSRTEVPPAEQPLPMVALQSGRRTSRPPSRSSFQDSRATLQPGRLSLNLDPRRMNNADTTSFVQPRRASISVDPRHSNNVSESIRAESARFSTRSTRIAEGREGENRGQSKQTRGKRIGEKIRGFFSKSRKQK